MKTDSKTLMEVCDIFTGNSAPQGDKYFHDGKFPFIRVKHISDTFNGYVKKFDLVNQKAVDEKKLKLYPKGSVVFAKSGMSIHLNVKARLPKDCYVVSHLAILIPKKEFIDPDYLYYWAKSFKFSNLSHETTLPSIKISDIKNVKILLPPLLVQRRIVSTLERIEKLKEKRQKANEETNKTIQAIFYEMFGDPHTNQKKWTITTIDKILEFSQYGTSKKSNTEKKGYPLLGMGNITYEGHLDLSKYGFVDLTKEEFKKLKIDKFDIIFNRTNSTELVGKTTYWNSDMDIVLASYLIRLKLKSSINSIFFSYLLNTNYYKRLFVAKCKKAIGQSNISASLLRTFPIYMPPISIQKKFASIVENFEIIRRKQTYSAEDMNQLFDALMQKAFNGELIN